MNSTNFRRLVKDSDTGILIMVYNNTNIWYSERTHKYGIDVQCRDKTGRPVMKTRRKPFSSLQTAKDYIDEQ